MRKLNISRNIFMAVFLAAAALCSGAVYIHHAHSDKSVYAKILQSCNNSDQTDYSHCLDTGILTFADTNPLKIGQFLTYVYQNARHMQPIDLRSFSDDSHYAGMLLASKQLTLAQAAKACGDSLEGGCLHGFVMYRLDDTDVAPDRLAGMSSYCQPLRDKKAQSLPYLNCLHGVGHEFWAKGRTNLAAALSYCNPLRQQNLETACWSGVLMEYSKTGVSTGFHSHTAVGLVKLPCATLTNLYQSTCYAAQGSYGQYEPNPDTPAQSYSYCNTIPAEYQRSCKAAVSTRLDLAVGKNLD